VHYRKKRFHARDATLAIRPWPVFGKAAEKEFAWIARSVAFARRCR
jgi:hypothetical protein